MSISGQLQNGTIQGCDLCYQVTYSQIQPFCPLSTSSLPGKIVIETGTRLLAQATKIQVRRVQILLCWRVVLTDVLGPVDGHVCPNSTAQSTHRNFVPGQRVNW